MYVDGDTRHQWTRKLRPHQVKPCSTHTFGDFFAAGDLAALGFGGALGLGEACDEDQRSTCVSDVIDEEEERGALM